MVKVNDDAFQWPFLLTEDGSGPPSVAAFSEYYGLPYRLGPRGDVLILGAGSGNDVAAALMSGAQHVTAVEIDPVILAIGEELHPNAPYSDPRVEIVNDNARSFLSGTERKFDLVVMGLLDSHALYSNLPGIRLDNYMYTVESFRRIREVLAPRGRLVVSFMSTAPWMTERQEALLREAFGRAPRLIRRNLGPYGIDVFTIAPGVDEPQAQPVPAAPTTDLPTDDWPYLYLRERGIPWHYQVIVAGIVILSLLAVRGATGGSGRARLDPGFFLLGAGFMLLETSAVVLLSRHFGATWIVTTAVLTAIFAFVLLGTGVALKTPREITLTVGGALLAFLVVEGLAAPRVGALAPSEGRTFLLAAFVLAPVALASFVFCRALESTADRRLALGSNLLGGVVGGFSEYVSMLWGLNSLWWVAVLFYGGALVFLVRRWRVTGLRAPTLAP